MVSFLALALALLSPGQIRIPDRNPIVVPGPVCAAEDGWTLGGVDLFTGRDGADLLSVGPEAYFEGSCGNFVIPTDVLFDFNRSELKPEAAPILKAVADYLKTVKDVYYVDGHADSVGSEAYNYELGLRRARAVVAALTGMGVSSDRLIARSFGKTRPIAPNDTDAGRARNRRVELIRLNLDVAPRSVLPVTSELSSIDEPAPPEASAAP